MATIQTAKLSMVFFSTIRVIRFVKECHLPSKAGAKIVSAVVPPSNPSLFFRLFFEQKL